MCSHTPPTTHTSRVHATRSSHWALEVHVMPEASGVVDASPSVKRVAGASLHPKRRSREAHAVLRKKVCIVTS
jgi:hypothetical protein